MKGFYLAQQGHVVQALAPVNVTGGKTSQAFSMKNYGHASILVLIGAQAGQMTKLIVNACTDASGDNAVAIPFNLFTAETASGDVLSGKVSVPATGYQPSATAGIFYVIELDSDALLAAADANGQHDYVQVQLTNGANADYAAIVAILSGARFAEDQSPTVIT